MRQLQNVLWTKGVLLSPQHLQAQDRFHEELLQFRLAALSFCPWGFARLEIDREALAAGRLALADAAGVFPDGLLFDIPEADEPPPPRPLEEVWPGGDADAVTVHLAVPEHRAGGHNVSLQGRPAATRYVAEPALRRDENTGQAEKPILLARKNLRLLGGDEPLEGSATLPLARVVRSATGEWDLDPHFVPPLVDIGASEYLLSLNRRLVELLSARSATLGGMRRQRSQGLADFGVSDIANFWLLYTVNTYLPELRHTFEVRRGHPVELFETMSELTGALTTFSSSIQPRDLPAYDHTDLTACFTRLDEMVRHLLETVVPTNYAALPLRPTEPAIHATAIDQDRYFEGRRFFLAVQAGVDRAALIRRAPQLLKVSSADQIERLIKQALPGVPLRHAASPPSEIPIKLDHQYFELDPSVDDWKAVRRARNLAVYVPSDFPDPKLELIVVLPPNDG